MLQFFCKFIKIRGFSTVLSSAFNLSLSVKPFSYKTTEVKLQPEINKVNLKTKPRTESNINTNNKSEDKFKSDLKTNAKNYPNKNAKKDNPGSQTNKYNEINTITNIPKIYPKKPERFNLRQSYQKENIPGRKKIIII